MVYHTFRARDRAHTHPTARANDVHSAKKRQNLMKRQKKNVIDADENPFSRDDATMRRARTPRVCVQRLSLDVFRCVSRPVNPRASRSVVDRSIETTGLRQFFHTVCTRYPAAATRRRASDAHAVARCGVYAR